MKANPVLWSAGQKEGFAALLELAEAFFIGGVAEIPIRPRFDPLIVGATGVGKSHLVRALAEHLDVPLIRVSIGEWISAGARDPLPTIARLHAFVESNLRGVIHIDELDKFESRGSDWSTAQMAELFFLLDRSTAAPTRAKNWTPELSEKLEKQFLMVGSGTWQDLWTQRRSGTLGFGIGNSHSPSKNLTEIHALIRRSNIIPPELLRRFRSEWVVLLEPTIEDFREGAAQLGLTGLAAELGVELDYRAAVSAGTGARWLEETYTNLLIEIHRRGRPDLLSIPDTRDNDTDISAEWNDSF